MKRTDEDPPIEYQREYNKLRPLIHRLLFIEEIIDQCDAAANMFAHMHDIRNREPNAQVLFYMAHAFLVFAANVAKVLTPPKKAAPSTKARALLLQADLSLNPEDLAALSRARNHLEHFDERMDKYLTMQSQNTLRKRIMFQAIILSDERDPRISALGPNAIFLKRLITSSWSLSLCGDEFQLHDLMNFIAHIAHTAVQAKSSIEAKLAEGQAHLETLFHLADYPPRVKTPSPSSA